MKSISLICIFCFLCLGLQSQGRTSFSATIKDADTHEPLAAVSINIYQRDAHSGSISNKEGKFSITILPSMDSIKFSMVGYHSVVITGAQLVDKMPAEIALTRYPVILDEVTVRPPLAADIVMKAINAIPGFQPGDNFQSRGFYREFIKDRDHYFSVAEAIFLAQYFPSKKAFKLKMEQGRSKEDVSYTRLFEDFHPSGGPQAVASMSFITDRPAFLDAKKISLFHYKLEKMVELDNHLLYCIGFDQNAGVKEALEKGKLYIDVDNFAVMSYEAENSPAGTPYIKDLSGTDKIFAQILHIDFKRKGWKRNVSFARVNHQLFLSHAEEVIQIAYLQPKKNIDLDLTLNIEWLSTEPDLPFSKEISKEEEWKKKNMAMNLPTAFDSSFWGDHNIIAPTAMIREIIDSISKTNHEPSGNPSMAGWQYLNRNFILSRQRGDTILIRPLMKSSWEDEETGGMIYQPLNGDFTIESKIDLSKTSSPTESPDRGFQQAGLIIRKKDGEKENYFLLSLGTGGNAQPKLFFKKTTDNKSKTVIAHEVSMSGWLKLIKSGDKITAFFRRDESVVWEKAGEFESEWLKQEVQVGLLVFAHFPGSGPKMIPDIEAAFSSYKISGS